MQNFWLLISLPRPPDCTVRWGEPAGRGVCQRPATAWPYPLQHHKTAQPGHESLRHQQATQGVSWMRVEDTGQVRTKGQWVSGVWANGWVTCGAMGKRRVGQWVSDVWSSGWVTCGAMGEGRVRQWVRGVWGNGWGACGATGEGRVEQWVSGV